MTTLAAASHGPKHTLFAAASGGDRVTTVVVVVVVVVVVILVAVAASVARRRRSGESYSVEGYRRTLHTLEGLGSRRVEGRPAVRMPSDARRVGGNRPERSTGAEPLPTDATRQLPLVGQQSLPRDLAGRVVPVPASSTSRSSRTSRTIGAAAGAAGEAGQPDVVFDDAARPATEAAPLGGFHRRPARRRPAVPVTAAAVVVAAVVGVVLGLELTGGPSGSPAASHTGHRTSGHKHQPPPTSTTPAQYTAVTSTASTATYVPAAASYSLQVGSTAGGRCWISVTSSSGTTVFAETLSTGASKTLAMSGNVTMVIGAPAAAAISIDQVPLVLPPGAQAPFDVTLAPASSTQ